MNKDELDEKNRLISTGMHTAVVIDVMVSRWNGRWQMSGEEVRCRGCLAPQWPSNAGEPVRHRPGCPNLAYSYPWQDLSELLQEMVDLTGKGLIKR